MATTYGILSTYPPTQCGLATFSAALAAALRGPTDIVEVVAVADAPPLPRIDGPVHVWVTNDTSDTDGAAAAAARLNGYDIAIIQHEYGIFGGLDGEDVLDLVRGVTVPLVVVLHTVLTDPTVRQREILDELVLRADAVVTMTHTARERLFQNYLVPPAVDVHVVPHGAAESRPTAVPAPLDAGDDSCANIHRPTVLTWGLLGVGKGIEWGIDAMASLRDLDPPPRYLVVGQTHPKVLDHEGERYRHGLEARMLSRGVQDLVEFDPRYLSTDDLQQIIRHADVVLLPYDSREQVTSGVLVEAVSAGRPVVATAFPHARELLAGGAGILVERADPAAIAEALRRVLTVDGLAAAMTAEATRLAPQLLWTSVAQQYRELAAAVLSANQDRLSA